MMRAGKMNASLGCDLIRFSSKKLAAILAERQMTAYALAKRLNVSTTWVQNLLSGKINMPRNKYLEILTKELQVSFTDLIEFAPEGEVDVEPTPFEEDWEARDIRLHAPNTPLAEAVGVLEKYDDLDAAGRRAVDALMDGLHRSKQKEGNKTALEG